MEAPYLSVVAGSRNDDHGGGMARRMRHFAVNLAAQARRFELPTELVLVEWNPPEDRPPLAESQAWPGGDDLFRFRIVTVPPEIHRRYPTAAQVPFYQYLSKNAGIRRAEGRFILVTNVDVILDDALFARLAARDLEAGVTYRTARWDVARDLPFDEDHDRRQAIYRRHVRRVLYHYGALEVPEDLRGDLPAIAALMAREMDRMQRLHEGLRPLLGERWPVMEAIQRLHCNASGDFALMAREDWFALRAYPEWPIHSWHLDSLFLLQLMEAGIINRSFDWDLPIYHIEHDPGWGQVFTEGAAVSVAEEGGALRVTAESVHMPFLTFERLLQLHKVFAGRGRVVFNRSGWGLHDLDLPETRI